LSKQRLEPTLAGSETGKHPKTFGSSLIISATIEVATSNLVHNVSLGLSCRKQRLGPKLVGSELGKYCKSLGSLLLQPLK